jgi:HlyD family secretion protein
MKFSNLFFATASLLLLASCKTGDNQFDAQGTFEADEVLVSAEIPGKLTTFTIQEGDTLPAGATVGQVDALNLSLQKEQVQASIAALHQKTADEQPQLQLLKDQLALQEVQLQNLQKEKARIERLLKMDAATGKQLDDISFQLDALQKQMMVTKQQVAVQVNNIRTQNRSILSEADPLKIRAEQIDDQIKRASIINPIQGTVLTKYAEQGEITSMGKALYKIADLSTLTLRAYITGNQLPAIKLGQKVTVYTDNGKDGYDQHSGTITWIADKAEFTPKTIQTKEERANLVYAVKIKVKNNGYLKLGMYGEITFQNQ